MGSMWRCGRKIDKYPPLEEQKHPSSCTVFWLNCVPPLSVSFLSVLVSIFYILIFYFLVICLHLYKYFFSWMEETVMWPNSTPRGSIQYLWVCVFVDNKRKIHIIIISFIFSLNKSCFYSLWFCFLLHWTVNQVCGVI